MFFLVYSNPYINYHNASSDNNSNSHLPEDNYSSYKQDSNNNTNSHNNVLHSSANSSTKHSTAPTLLPDFAGHYIFLLEYIESCDEFIYLDPGNSVVGML